MTTLEVRSPRAAPMRRLAAQGAGRRRTRGSTMIEFVLILPLLLFVALFTVDMGNVILVNGAMQDTAYSAARAGAQVGGASLTADGSYPCGTTASTSCKQGASYDAFASAVATVPGYTSNHLTNVHMQILTGGKCAAQSTSARSDNHVTVKVTYDQKLATPGLALLMSWSGTTIDNGAWQMSVTAASRCEVVR